MLQMPYDSIIDSSKMKLWLEHSKESNETDNFELEEMGEEQHWY